MNQWFEQRVKYRQLQELHQEQGSYTRPFRRPPRIVIVLADRISGHTPLVRRPAKRFGCLSPKEEILHASSIEFNKYSPSNMRTRVATASKTIIMWRSFCQLLRLGGSVQASSGNIAVRASAISYFVCTRKASKSALDRLAFHREHRDLLA